MNEWAKNIFEKLFTFSVFVLWVCISFLVKLFLTTYVYTAAVSYLSSLWLKYEKKNNNNQKIHQKFEEKETANIYSSSEYCCGKNIKTDIYFKDAAITVVAAWALAAEVTWKHLTFDCSPSEILFLSIMCETLEGEKHFP